MDPNNDSLSLDNLELGGEESLSFEDVISEAFGVSSVEEILVDADTEDIDEDLSEDIFGDETTGITADAMGQDYVRAFIPYLSLLTAIQALLNVNGEASTTGLMSINSAEFEYMPPDVLRTFNSMLIDMARSDDYRNVPVEQCAEAILKMLFEVTQWAPALNRPEFLSSFKTWYLKFRRIGNTQTVSNEQSIVDLVDANGVRDALEFFVINTEAFNIINEFFKDTAKALTNALLDYNQLGILSATYMETHNLARLSVTEAYNAIMEYFTSEDYRQAVHITVDEVTRFTLGELLRRLLVYEFSNEIIYPFGVQGRPVDDYDTFLQCLKDAMNAGSVASEIFYILVNITSAVEGSKGKGIPITLSLLRGGMRFYQAYIRDDSLINPVMYSKVKKTASGSFEISYLHGEDTITVSSHSVLCEVVGDRTSVYCVPYVIVDRAHGCVICPPIDLVTPMRSVAISGRMKIAGAVLFKFSPTISWIADNGVVAVEETVEVEERVGAIKDGGNPLLPIIMNYSNNFTDSGVPVQPVIVSSNGFVIHSVSGQKSDGTMQIYLVEHEESGEVVAKSGVLVFDPNTKNMVVSFMTLSGQPVEFVANENQYFEEYLGTSVDTDTEDVSLSDFVHIARESTCADFQEYRKAVKSLCELAALDYEEELQSAQAVIARELYSIVYVSAVDELIASRILDVYDSVIAERADGHEDLILDDFNFASFKELADIITGKDNPFRTLKAWGPNELKKYKEYKDRFAVNVDSFCRRMDSLDLSVLALQILSHSEIPRECDMLVYYALHGIPEIGSRLAGLEDRMVTLHVLDLLGNQVLSVFSKRAYLGKAYMSQILKDNIDGVHRALLEKSRKRDGAYSMPLSKRMLNNDGAAADDIVAKYFILEQNIYGLLDTVYSSPEVYEGYYQSFVEDLDLPMTFDIKAISAREFEKLVPTERVTAFYEKNRALLCGLVERGLLYEAASNNGFQVVKAFDLFNSFYSLIVGVSREDEGERYWASLCEYAASMIVSYCPVFGMAVGDIDGGELRSMAFARDHSDFVYDAPIEYLKQFNLRDLRVAIESD